MRFESVESSIKRRIVMELPEVTDHLIDITEFTREEISSRILSRPTFAGVRIDQYDIHQLSSARVMGDVTWYAGTSYNDTMRSAVETSLTALVRVKNKIDNVVPHQRESVGQHLLFATRSIIAHTPYPQAFSTRQRHRGNKSLRDHVAKHQDGYSGLLPYMGKSQRKTTDELLKTL